MTRVQLAMCAAGIGLLVQACGSGASAPRPAAPDVAATSAKLTAFLDAEFEKELQLSPESLTSIGRKDQYDELDDRSEAAAERALAWRRQSVAALKAQFDPSALDEEARTSYDVWALALDYEEATHKFRHHAYQFAQLGGPHTGLPQFLITQHRVDDLSDMRAYIARATAIGRALDQVLERTKASASAGIRMPRFVYGKVMAESKEMVSGAPFSKGPDNALFADGKAKIKALVDGGKATLDQGRQLEVDLARALTVDMRPAYDRLAAWLQLDQANTAPEAAGVSALPDGRAFYDAMLFLRTTTALTADEVHDLGLREVARLRSEMEGVMRGTGFSGTLPAFFTFMRGNPKFVYANTDEGRAAYLAKADEYLKGVKAKLPEYFGLLPKADLVVRRVERFREVPGGAQHYVAGTPDGSRPGVFYAHLSDMGAMPTYQLEDIAYHEGLPGHHMQLSIAQERTGLPLFRTQYGFTAYTEGWGLYSEALAKEMGFYGDPYSDFGRLSGEMWRAIRLVLDSGIHAKGWTEEQAVAFFKENSPQPEAAIRSEVRRYITTPGQASSYKIGMIRLQQLRDRARQRLGARFSYPAFHDVVLGGGGLPLPVLEARVDRWLAATEAAPTR